MKQKILFLSFVVVSCLFAASKDRMDQLDVSMQKVVDRILHIETAIKLWNQKAQDSDEKNRHMRADTQVLVDDLRTELSQLKGELELLKNETTQAQENQKNVLKDFDFRLQELEKGGGKHPAAQGALGAQPLYDEALALLQKKHAPDKAQNLFETFLEKHPTHALAGNAQYWIGECHEDQKEYALAIKAFDKVVKLYPQSSKKCDALLKQGLGFKALKKAEDAKLFFQEVVSTCPKTSAATQAQKNLVK